MYNKSQIETKSTQVDNNTHLLIQVDMNQGFSGLLHTNI